LATILFSRPADDTQLSYLHYYSKELVDYAVRKGHKAINKELQEANKKKIISLIQSQKPELLMFNGHGSSNVICGYKQEVIIDINNIRLLKDTITYSLSCSSADVLGKEAIKNGTICFIGYESEFALGKDPDSEASPRHDKITKLFLEPSNILFSSLIEGDQVNTAVIKAKKKMWENISYLNTTKSFPEAIFYAPFLFGNYICLVAHGNKEASI